MAKISAYGAREVARCYTGRSIERRLWVMTSDGRILSRFTNPATEFYLVTRGVESFKRSIHGLREYVTALGNVPED
jgi:hypothetical protein